ncbi:ATP-binding cassette domain-containing protein [Arenivirga flava]|uniref:ABC transporter domain-containing protein n=1 Tax=Arenivirga flava TaxID=1930060 RepID=A0AA37XCB4_9MICO|nr:ATP-binding cassette domain-containing protein [Arenivirga flava]GMA29520.1 hypothetical protein GCM10025874_27730 [Arenivirga flava]
MSAVLRIDDLRIETTGEAPRALVDGVSLRVDRGEALGVVGESGSGKSLTVLAALGLLPAGTRIAGGRIAIDDRVLVDAEAGAWAGSASCAPCADAPPRWCSRTRCRPSTRCGPWARRSPPPCGCTRR